MSRSENPTVTIAPGVEMPLLGFGTWMATGDDARRALDAGYRHIDTATSTATRIRSAGRCATADCRVTRCSSRPSCRQGNAGRERETIEASLEALGLDQVDLWLIHWPPGGRARPDVWQRFAEIAEAGLTRAIGVSNYDLAQVDEITEATGVAPAVDQIPWSPSLFDAEVADGLRTRGVTLEGYSPFKTANCERPGARGDREAPRRHDASGHPALAHRPRVRRDPEVEQSRAHRLELRRLRLRAHGRRARTHRRPRRLKAPSARAGSDSDLSSVRRDGRHPGRLEAFRRRGVGRGPRRVRRRPRGGARRPGRARRARAVAVVARRARGGHRQPPRGLRGLPAARRRSARRRALPCTWRASTGSTASGRPRPAGSRGRAACSTERERSASSAGCASRRPSARTTRRPRSDTRARRSPWRTSWPTPTSSAWRSRSSAAPSSPRAGSRRASRYLDEAMTVALGGETSDPLACGDACCTTLVVCDGLADLERAAEWCEAVVDFAERRRFTPVQSWCRAIYGARARARRRMGARRGGAHRGARAHGRTARRGGGRALPLAVLAELRLRQGRQRGGRAAARRPRGRAASRSPRSCCCTSQRGDARATRAALLERGATAPGDATLLAASAARSRSQRGDLDGGGGAAAARLRGARRARSSARTCAPRAALLAGSRRRCAAGTPRDGRRRARGGRRRASPRSGCRSRRRARGSSSRGVAGRAPARRSRSPRRARHATPSSASGRGAMPTRRRRCCATSERAAARAARGDARRADRARARGARPGRRGPLERRDRRAARDRAEDRRAPRRPRARASSACAAAPRRPRTPCARASERPTAQRGCRSPRRRRPGRSGA